MANKDILNGFGASLMTSVRDRSIDRFEKIQSGSLKAPKAIELHDLLSQFSIEQQSIIKKLIIESVDNTIFNFLFMFEENEDKKILVSDININEISDGLSGELFSDDGWISRFSKK